MTIKSNVNDHIDPRAIPIVLITALAQFNLIFTGRKVLLIAGRDSWLAVLLGGVLATLGTYCLLRLMKRFPKENFFEYLSQVWGKPLGWIIAIGYLLFWSFFLTILFKNTAEANMLFFLQKTPKLIPIFLLAFAAVWLVSYGFAVLIRFTQIISPLFFLPLIISLFLALSKIEINHFFPILSNGILPVLKGAVLYTGYFHGLEVILFLSPLLINTTKAFKPTLLGVFIINIFAFLLIILVIGILGVYNTNIILWPGFAILSLVEIPGLPAERFELLLTLPLLIAALIAISVTLYLLSNGLIQLLKISRHKPIIYLTAFFTALAILLIPNFAWAIKLREINIYLTLIFTFFLPIFTLLLAVIRKRGIPDEK